MTLSRQLWQLRKGHLQLLRARASGPPAHRSETTQFAWTLAGRHATCIVGGEVMFPSSRRPRDLARRSSRRPRRISTTKIPVPSIAEIAEAVAREEVKARGDRFLLTVLRGDPLGRVIRVDDDGVTIGRGENADFVLDDPGLSWSHARIFRQGGQVWVEDLGSTNGTFVGDRRIREPTVVGDGARIGLGGHTVLKLSLADELEEESARRLYDSTVKDALTSVHNRRYLVERLATEISFAQRHSDTVAVLLVDLDHFKQINDTHGHHVGDAVLRVVAAAMQRVLRPEDLLARFGGDEFVIVARSVTDENAHILAERLRAHIAGLSLPLEGSQHITVSIGMAVAGPQHAYPAPDALLAAADTAMYEAKHQGRNRVVAHG
ncbi:MAG: GGDEF domain-containing protein [Planctomycetaceae bacterium]|nr:GGDEF domain-containing protein [Planctomycetaceae bacterium]